MKAVLIIPADDAQELRSREVAKEPTLQELQDIVDGYIEVVPHWRKHMGHRCVVYCNEEGKLHRLPINKRATALWYVALGRRLDDVLCGDVVMVMNLPRDKGGA